MIRYAGRGDIPELKRLMNEIFGDSDSEMELYFDRLFFDDCALVYCDGGIASVVYLLPAAVFVDGVRHGARYIYAAATRADCRGMGYMSRLLDAAADECRRRGYDYLILLAADDGLTEFYGRRGYYRAFGCEERIYSVTDGGVLPTGAATSALVKQCRNAAVMSVGGAVWEEPLFDHMFRTYADSGLDWLSLGLGYALVDRANCLVNELVCFDTEGALRTVCRLYGWSACRYRAVSDAAPSRGMALPLKSGLPLPHGYMGLCLE